MQFDKFKTGRLSIALAIFSAMVFGQTARADEWEGLWAESCAKGADIELSKRMFNLSAFEMQCTPLGSRKLGSRYIVDLSCDGEGGAQRMRAQIEVRNNEMKISGIHVDLGTLHRCASDKPK